MFVSNCRKIPIGLPSMSRIVLGRDSYVSYDHLLEAHQAALGDLLDVRVLPGGHTVLWDAFEETLEAVAGFLRADAPSASRS